MGMTGGVAVRVGVWEKGSFCSWLGVGLNMDSRSGLAADVGGRCLHSAPAYDDGASACMPNVRVRGFWRVTMVGGARQMGSRELGRVAGFRMRGGGLGVGKFLFSANGDPIRVGGQPVSPHPIVGGLLCFKSRRVGEEVLPTEGPSR